MINISEPLEWLKIALGKNKNVNTIPSKENIELWKSLQQEEVDETLQAINNNDFDEIKDGIIDQFWILCNLIYFCGIPEHELNETFKKVTVSNFSKFCVTEEEAIDTVKMYKTKGVNCSYSKVEDLYVIRRNDGKILKSIKYIPVSQL